MLVKIFLSLLIVCCALVSNADLLCPKQVNEALTKLNIKKENVDVISNDECVGEMFEVKLKVKKSFLLKGIQLAEGATIDVLDNSVNFIEGSGGSTIKINNKITCMNMIQFGRDPNRVCDCILAEPIEYNKVTIPKGVKVHFEEQLKTERIEVIEKEINLLGKTLTSGKSFKIQNKKIIEVPNETSSDCGWD